MVEREQQAGDVAERRRRAAAVLDRAHRLALEVDEDEPVRRPQDLAEVEVAVDAAQERRRARRLEGREPEPDRVGPGPQVGAHGRIPGEEAQRLVEPLLAKRPPAAEVVGVGRARRETLDIARIGEAGVELGQDGPELGGVLGGELEGDHAGRRDPAARRSRVVS